MISLGEFPRLWGEPYGSPLWRDLKTITKASQKIKKRYKAMLQKSCTLFLFIVITGLVIVVALGFHFVFRQPATPRVDQSPRTSVETSVPTETTKEPQQESTIAREPTATWKTYRNGTFAYTVKYPVDWRVSEEIAKHPDDVRRHSAYFGPPEKKEVFITVYPTDWEGVIREAFSPVSEEKTVVGGVEATKLVGRYQRDNNGVYTQLTLFLVRKGNYLYELKGGGTIFNHMVSFFEFTK